MSTCDIESTHANYPLKVRKVVFEKRRLRRVWHQSRLDADKKIFFETSVQLKET